MGDEESATEEIHGEDLKSVPGEGHELEYKLVPGGPPDQFQLGHVLQERVLTFEEASRCLSNLGKDESGIRYAYLMLSAVDRQLTNVKMILNFKHVLFVDISGNFLNLEAVDVLADMPFLVYLKAERNVIESAALRPIPFLQVLNLNRNTITETCDIVQPIMECLELNFNDIYTAQFDGSRLKELRQLEMRGNHLPDLSGSYPPSVENLYLAQNRISRFIPQDLSQLTNLKILHLRENHIRKLNGFTPNLANLTYLNLRKNKINKLRQFRKLMCLPKLETLIVLENPVADSGAPARDTARSGSEEEAIEEEEFGEDGPPIDKVRLGLLVILPNLKRINKMPVTIDERNAAFEARDSKWQEIMEEDSSEDEDYATTTEFSTEYTSEAEIDVERLNVSEPAFGEEEEARE